MSVAPVFRPKPGRSQERDDRHPAVIEAERVLNDAQFAYRQSLVQVDKVLRPADLDAAGNGQGTKASATQAAAVRARFYRFK